MNNIYISGKNEKIFLDNALSPEAESLNRYLGQYGRLKRAKHSLEDMRKEIISEFDSPLHSVVMDGMPKAQGTVSNGAASLSLKLSDIEYRIKLQEEKMVTMVNQIMEICCMLPMDSSERMILEKRYIAGKSWHNISNEISYSKAGTIIHWKRGLYMLLEFEKVRDVVSDWVHQELLRKMGLSE